MMKYKAILPFSILFLAILSINLGICSCQNRAILSSLYAADALMMAHPEKARDTLKTISKDDVRNLSLADKAFFTLLRTEAEYKSYLPVAQDTAIFDVVTYYQEHGPQDRLARALVLQGAVYEERNEPTLAMESFKEAEPIIEASGDLENLGLINIRIGEIYQHSIINISAAVERYKKALDCFERIDAKTRIASTNLSLASALLIDSLDIAEPYLENGLKSALELNEQLDILSGYELYTYLYNRKKEYREIINIAKHIVSTYGECLKNPVEKDLYESILYNCIESYAIIGQIDSARLFASKLPLVSQSDSLFFYSARVDIATAEGDWREAFDCQKEAHRIEDEMKQASYDAQLVEVERKYENSVLREQLYERNNRILVLVLVYAGISLAAAGAFLLLRRLLRRQKAEIDHQAGIVRELHDTASRLERDLKSKASEADALKAEKQQEEETRRDLEAMLTRQSSSNQELMRYYGKAQKAMRDIVNIYDARSSNPRHFMDDALEVARGFIVEMNSPGNATTLIETAYPGFLDRLFEEFPGLSEEDRHLIILTCCGYPNGAVCTILGISESNLAVRKTRLAHRMGIDTSLAKFLRKRLVANPG